MYTPVVPSFSHRLDALGAWRMQVLFRLKSLSRWLADADLLDEAAAELHESLTLRLRSDKLMLAFVAEFSRGKSELINAIFFADSGRRIMPAAAGRTTMCPVELAWDPEEPPSLRLLDIDTRTLATPMTELRRQPSLWRHTPLDVQSPQQLAQSLQAVMAVRDVSVDRARELGFWSDEDPQDNPPLLDNGLVQVPGWRHALINYPHPLLKQGLVILDTPGLNAIGAEPELTVSLLPAAHATLFILSADAGVTRSDMSIWRDHLCTQSDDTGRALTHFVALNKIDVLWDGLSTPAEIERQITRQRDETARTLGVPIERVFPLSAQKALGAKVRGDADLLRRSGLAQLEDALARELLPARRVLLRDSVLHGLRRLETDTQQRLADRRRQNSDELAELRSLRGKNASMVQHMLRRIESERKDFDRCIARVHAMRAVHARMLKQALADLSSQAVRDQLGGLRETLKNSFFHFGARQAFGVAFEALRNQLVGAQHKAGEIHAMLAASFEALNTEFGFALQVSASPELTRFERDLDLIERNYQQYLGISQAFSRQRHKFAEQFVRMLISKVRVAFEGAAGELEMWNRTASSQIDTQLRERRRAFGRRRETLERIQLATDELERRLREMEAQDDRLVRLLDELKGQVGSVRTAAEAELVPPSQAQPLVRLA